MQAARIASWVERMAEARAVSRAGAGTGLSQQGGQTSGILLLFYWTLNLPALGQGLVMQRQEG